MNIKFTNLTVLGLDKMNKMILEDFGLKLRVSRHVMGQLVCESWFPVIKIGDF
jgi:hypothetical protein